MRDAQLRRDAVITVLALLLGGALVWWRMGQGTGATREQPELRSTPSDVRGEPQETATEAVGSPRVLFFRTAQDRGVGPVSLAALPSVVSGYRSGARLGDSEFVLTDIFSIDQRRHVLEYRVSDGVLLSQLNTDAISCEKPFDVTVHRNLLYIACIGEGVVVIDPARDEVRITYDARSGLQNLLNLRFATTEDSVWVGTFNGVGRIVPDQEEIVWYDDDKLGIPGQASVIVHTRGNEVWVQVLAHAASSGGAARFHPTNSRWTPFGPDVFGKTGNVNDERIDFERFIVSDRGTFAVYQDGGPERVLVSKFNTTSETWEVLARTDWQHRDEVIARFLPSTTSYADFESLPMDRDGTISFRVREGAAWRTVPSRGRQYLATTILGTTPPDQYILSTAGMEWWSRTSLLPRLLAPAPVLPSLQAPTLYPVGDRAIVAYSAFVNEMDGELMWVDIGTFDAVAEKLVFRRIEAATLPSDHSLLTVRELRPEFVEDGDRISLVFDGKPLIVVDLNTGNASVIP